MSKYVNYDDVITATWKALYDYEDRTEKQFIDSEELDVEDWFLHRIFVQGIHAEILDAVMKLYAIEIPPHGRLIDADALRDNNSSVIEINSPDGTILAIDVAIIDDAPTVIPAEDPSIMPNAEA